MTHSFSITHQGRGGYIEYQDGECMVRMSIELLVARKGEPLFAILVPVVDETLKPILLARLHDWLKDSAYKCEVVQSAA